ncbi:MAG: alpha-1,4-glucan--maltose-1-phosphate maltosyltransferase [Candidatus Omnitrophica bacterium]|nr:alpha-1,4-glucan--maltose-1-phosphate maltosyltransferase [Candidatus Omnitrophota bacterium]
MPTPPSDLRDFSPLVIENLQPDVGAGRFNVKGVAGHPVRVSALVYKDGQDFLGASVIWRRRDRVQWEESPMRPLENDVWEGVFTPEDNAAYVFSVEAWMDPLTSWADRTRKKAGVNESLPIELEEGAALLGMCRGKEAAAQASRWAERLMRTRGNSADILGMLDDPEFWNFVPKAKLRFFVARHEERPIMVDRPRALFGTWYEMFPRSQAAVPGAHGTFKDCIRRIADIREMGFDVIYLPPIHPIGITNRKGRNNALKAGPKDVGSPWGIGSAEGGHMAVHPKLGTLKDFEAFAAAAKDAGMEIALDFAAQCSPDHPYVKEHPEWFRRLSDGTIRYAENPPKKYQDIYPLDFMCVNRQELWEEMKRIVLFWAAKGVRIFRVDNPHTKPLLFWRWLIDGVQKDHPDILFLAEAFTRPSVMKFLAKAGFTQSYTYFTWRNSKWELTTYLEELNHTPMRNYFRPNFFTNTPDILQEILQKGGPPAFRMRLVLAATLSASYGIYSGYELCENTATHEGSEEYLNSEKYEIPSRDWHAPGNIRDLIAAVNRARHDHPALQQNGNIEFIPTRNDAVLAHVKWDDGMTDIIVTVVNLDPYAVQEDQIQLPIWKFGIEEWQTFEMRDLLGGDKYHWKGREHYVRLDPSLGPGHVFHLKK